jgi:hypothetical protein
MYQLICVISPHLLAPREKIRNPSQLASFVELHQDFETKENPWQPVVHFGDRVIAENNSREIVTKQTNEIASPRAMKGQRSGSSG